MNEFSSTGTDFSGSASGTNNPSTEAVAKARELKATFSELCRLAPAAALDSLAELTTSGKQLLSAGKDQVVEASCQVMATVRKHPVESAAIAALAVFGVWSLFKLQRK